LFDWTKEERIRNAIDGVGGAWWNGGDLKVPEPEGVQVKREAGENPARSRHCEQPATGSGATAPRRGGKASRKRRELRARRPALGWTGATLRERAAAGRRFFFQGFFEKQTDFSKA